MTVGVTYFYSAFTDLIDFEEGPAAPGQPLTGHSAGCGDVSRRTPLAEPQHYRALNLSPDDIKGTTEPLRNRPKWRGGFAVQWYPRSDLDVSLHTVVVGQASDSSIPTGARTLDAYARVDLAATWTMTKHWKFFFAIDNVWYCLRRVRRLPGTGY